MPYYTPLRYPGGKRRLIPILTRLLEENELKDIQYAEPCAGGASVAIALLIEEYASVIHINDLSRPVYAFWYEVLNDTNNLCKRIKSTDITIKEWYKQRDIFNSQDSVNLTDLGFATLFLNRTNHSGILSGGVIGGKNQSGIWHIDARFNKNEIIQRIEKISRYKSRIKLYHMDALEFTKQILSKMGMNTFVFYDPPYIENGYGLYLDNYNISDHIKLAKYIAKVRQYWVCTYDYAAIQHQLFHRHRRITYELQYTAQDRYEGKEVMFLSNNLKLPPSWLNTGHPIVLTPESDKYTLCGIFDVG